MNVLDEISHSFSERGRVGPGKLDVTLVPDSGKTSSVECG